MTEPPPKSQLQEVDSAPTRQARWGWYLFDFALAIIINNGGLYFPEWIIKENGVSDIWFNFTIVASSALVLVTAPFFGLLFDRKAERSYYLYITSSMIFGGGIAISLAGYLIQSWAWRVTLSLIAFGIIMYAFQLGLVFYNVLLGRVSLPSDRAAVSGNGLAWGWIGGILSIFLIYPFVEGKILLFQPAGRIQAILPATLAYGILTVISLWLLSKGRQTNQPTTPLKGHEAFQSIFQTAKQIPLIRPLFLFIISYICFSDAILTIQNNSTIYMGSVFNLNVNSQAAIYVVFLSLSAVGALLSAWIIKRLEHKSAMFISLYTWLALILITLCVRSPFSGGVLLSLMGFANGMLWNTSRVWFYALAPAAIRGQLFGFYASLERVATFIGPLLWTVSVALPATKSLNNYKIALAAMGVLVFISLIPLNKMNPGVRR